MMNGKNLAKKISEFILDLSMMDDDFEKVNKYEKFISSLEDELKRISCLSDQFVFCVYFLKEAIDRFKDLKRASEVRALTKLCKRKFDNIANAEDINNNNKKGLSSFAKPGTNAPFSDHQVINLDSDDEGTLGSVCTDQKHIKSSVFSKALVSTALMAQSEPREKSTFAWSLDMRRRFCDAVDALGGPLVAMPKNIKELMNVADVTEEDIRSHMLLQNYRPGQVHNTCLMVSQDVLKMDKKVIQSGSRSLHIGESSNGQAAAAAVRGTSSSWALVCRQMLVQSEAIEMPESWSSQMAAVSENDGWKLDSQPYGPYKNGPMNNNK